MSTKKVFIAADPDAVAQIVGERFIDRLKRSLAKEELVHVSLTGGTMGSKVLAAAAEHPEIDQIDWSRVHFWWGDERFVAQDSDDRNQIQNANALLDKIQIPASNIHVVLGADQCDGDLDAAAAEYAAQLAQFPSANGPWPSFDICFLGVGPDGHIASLFPDRREIRVVSSATVAVRNSPKPPAERVSLTRPVLNSSKRVWHVLTGADKASALGLALAGANYDDVPVAGSKGTKSTIFFVDVAAAAQVPPQLIEGDYS